MRAINKGDKINRSIADQIASSMKEWAMAKGVTHYTHWFQPLTATNNVTTNDIDKGSYFLLDSGDPSDIIVSAVYDLSAYSSAEFKSHHHLHHYKLHHHAFLHGLNVRKE